jgi:hypothetical protein
MQRTFPLPFVSLAALCTVAACAQVPVKSSSSPVASMPGTSAAAGKRQSAIYKEHSSVTQVRRPSAAPSPESANPGDLLSAMGRDLAGRLGVKVAELQVLAIDQVVWDDGSLGCPQPGKSYLTAQVPGVRVLFQNSGKTYQYHASDRAHFVYCANPAQPAGSYEKQ